MAATSTRMLQLLSLLQTRRHWSGADLADRLGVSLRTLRRDVDRLRELGYPVEARPGVDGGYQLAPGASLPPLVLDDEEAVALAVGLLAAVHSPFTGTPEASLRALAKVIQVMPGRLRSRIDAVRAATHPATWATSEADVDPRSLVVLAQACRDTERLELGYTDAGGRRTERTVDPHHLVALDRRWYLLAFDRDRYDWRRFRLDRLADPRPTGERFVPRPVPGGDPAALVRAGIVDAPRPIAVDVVAHAPVEAVRERIGHYAQVERWTEGTSRVRFSSDSLRWAVLGLVSIETEIEVLGPESLIEQLEIWAGRFARAGGARPAGPRGSPGGHGR